MNATLLAALNDAERLLVAQTEPRELAPLSEDEAVDLHERIRKARNKYTGLYRRGASARVAEKGGRGRARPANERAGLKAEAFEQALSRVSRRVAVLARQSAARLRTERLELARAARNARGQQSARQPSSRARVSTPVPAAPSGDRSLRSPAAEKRRASTKAEGARRQARRDSR